MISRWKWMLKQTIKKLWFRATLFAIVAMLRLSRLVKSRRKAFKSPYIDISKITEKGNALAIVTVC
ncbi:hypothetical protein ACSLOP_30635, partial [Escherichia coli]